MKHLNEFEIFLKSENSLVPQEISSKVYSRIEKLINPNAFSVFLKILGLHLTVGFLSLSFCHQFGMNPFNTEYSLADWFMNVGGYYGCMIGCGVSFVSLSLLAAGLFLTPEEIKSLKRTEYLQNISLGLVSLGLFAAFGVELALGMAGLWLLGSLVGGFISTRVIIQLKAVY
jgi:hypothetical protein